MDVSTLYRRHASVAMAIAFRILGDAQEAEDVVQETFLELSRRAHEPPLERTSERAFIGTMARNRALDRLRSSKRRGQILAKVAQPFEPSQGTHNALSEARDAREVVDRAFAALTSAQRAVLELAYHGGLTHPEIAIRLGIPLGTVKTRIRLGIERLGVEIRKLR